MVVRTARSPSIRSHAIPPWLVAAGALAAAVGVGGVMTRSIELGMAAVVGLALVPLALMNLPLVITMWVATVSLVTVTPAPNVVGVLIFFAWLGTVGTRRSRAAVLSSVQRRALLATGALVLWVLLTMAWAPESPVGAEIFFSWLAVAAIMAVLSTTVISRRQLQWVATAFVIGVLLSVVIGAASGAVQAGSSQGAGGRFVGASGDPNFLAAGIVPAIVLAYALSVGRGREFRVAASSAAVVVLVVALVGTQSRGGLAAAAVAAVAVLVLTKRGRGSIVVALLWTAGVAALWFSMNPVAWQRMSNLGESSGRNELWHVGWRMWQDHPVTGVGLAGFRHESRGYVFELGPLRYAEYIVEVPKLAHNAYLDLMSETGFIGLALFGAVVATSIQCAWRASVRFDRIGDLQMVALARGVIAALVGILAASFFISNPTDRRTWILLAMGPALLGASKALSSSPPRRTKPRAVPRAPSSTAAQITSRASATRIERCPARTRASGEPHGCSADDLLGTSAACTRTAQAELRATTSEGFSHDGGISRGAACLDSAQAQSG